MPSPSDISLVIPVYNGASALTRALNSVFAQTVAPAEIIVVDDGSTDGSAAIAQGFGDRVRVISQANAGVSAARNRGVAEGRSELVAFLDADDEWMPSFLETIRRMVAAYHDCGMYCTAYARHFANGTEVPCLVRGLPDRSPHWIGILPDYFRIAAISDPPAWTSATVVHREALESVGGFPVGVASGEDLLTWARIAARRPVAYASVPLARFWQPADVAPGAVARPTRMPQNPDVVGQGLRELMPLLPPDQRCGLRLYMGLWHKMRASCYIRTRHSLDAWQEICLALLAARFSPRFIALILSSFLRSSLRLRRME